MSARRTERLLNLVICLLATRRWLTKEQIRGAVPQYAECGSDEAFDRMFERDKEDLRELGVPIRTGREPGWFDDELGYRIDRNAYELPPVHFDAQELAVLGLASRVWREASLAGPAARALAKLSSFGEEPDDGSIVGVEPRVRTAEPAFEPLYEATRDRAPVAFSYHKPDGDVTERQVQPWAVVSRSGHWYLVGHDTSRDEPRVFRLSRIESGVRRTGKPGSYQVPADLDARAYVAPMLPPPDTRPAQLRVRAGRAVSLRRRAQRVAVDRPGWDLLELPVGEVSMLAEELAGYGSDVIALEPPELREAVVRRLRAALAEQLGPVVRSRVGA